MQYKEFQTGVIQTGISNQRLFEETCREYSIASMDIINLSASAMRLSEVGGWVSQSAYGKAVNINIDRSNYFADYTAETQSNPSISLINTKGIGTNPSGTIAANNQASMAFSTKDIQIMFMNTERSAIGNAEVKGIFKGSIEGISKTFYIPSVTPASPSGWIDCRAYSTMSVDVVNLSNANIAPFTISWRRHKDNIPSGGNVSSVSITGSFANYFNVNPVGRLQRIREVASHSAVLDLNVFDLHSIQFSVPQNSCQLQGILKG